MSNTSTIHIKTDFDCKVYDYGQELGTTKSDTYFNVELRKGEHKLTFVYTGDDSISKTINYIIEDVDCDYRLVVKIVEIICDKAKEHFDSENYSVAFGLYSLAAEKSFPKALCGLGVCYYYGNGVEKDLTKAVEWFTKAAEQGDADAQYELGGCYDWGIGVEKDLTKAIELYTKAAKQGYADAQYELGHHYKYGDGVEKDFDKALECYKNAREGYTKAAEQGDADAQWNLGNIYKHGIGVEVNHIKAVEWFTKAAKQGDAIAQTSLGVCYVRGEGVEIDFTKAVEWFTKAAEQGDVDAQEYLGYCYKYGKGVEQNLTKSKEWFTKADEQGDYLSYNISEDFESMLHNNEDHYILYDDSPEDYDTDDDFNDLRKENWYAMTDDMYGDYPEGDIDYEDMGF